MNEKRVKEFIVLLIKKWDSRLPHQKVLEYIIDFLDSKSFKKDIFDNQFEFSLIENKNNIRLLHLLFWKDSASEKSIRNILKHREESIVNIFKEINSRFHKSFNLDFLENFLKFNRKNGLYPVQFSLEYDKEFLKVLKVYLSVNSKSFLLKNFSQYFGFKFSFLEKIFQGKKCDCLAIDFLSDGSYRFKLYSILNNKGLLHRVELPDKLISIKEYIRFPKGISIKNIPFKIDSDIKKFIDKIYYLTKEKGVKSFYFR